MENEFKGRVIFSENYQSTIESIRLINKSQSSTINITKALTDSDFKNEGSQINLINSFNKITKTNLESFKNNSSYNLSAYDESILELNSLEGKIRCIAHCAILQNEKEYIPAAFVSFVL